MERRQLRKWALGLLVLGLFFGMRQCQRSYARVLPVHLDVLTYTAAKLCGVIAAGRGLSAEGMAEYVYPARRAREFLAEYERHNDTASYRGLQRLVDQYEALVRDADAARATGADWQQRLPVLEKQRDALFVLADQIRNDLKRE